MSPYGYYFWYFDDENALKYIYLFRPKLRKKAIECLILMLKLLKPWMIQKPDDYAEFVKENIIETVNWQRDAHKFRIIFQKLFGEDRLTRYIYMTTGPAVFWLKYAYFVKSTIRDQFGCDSQEAKNFQFKYLMPKITTNLATAKGQEKGSGVLNTFKTLIKSLNSLRYDLHELNDYQNTKIVQQEIKGKYLIKKDNRLILNINKIQEETEILNDEPSQKPIVSDAAISQSLPDLNANASADVNECSQKYQITKFSKKQTVINSTLVWNNQRDKIKVISSDEQKIIRLTINKNSISMHRKKTGNVINVKHFDVKNIFLLTKEQLIEYKTEYRSNDYFKHLLTNEIATSDEGGVFVIVFKAPTKEETVLKRSALLFLLTNNMNPGKYDEWDNYFKCHDEFMHLYQPSNNTQISFSLIISKYDEDYINKDIEEREEMYNISKKGYMRDETDVCKEIESLFEDVDKCGSIDQTRRCLDCQEVITWNDYHVICNNGVTHSSNYTSMFYKKIYYEKWTVKETEDSAELCEESDFFKGNKHWLIPLRYKLHNKFVQIALPIAQQNPTQQSWPIDIDSFRPHVLKILKEINKQFQFNLSSIQPNIVYQDMYQYWIIKRNSINKFQVRSDYKPNDILNEEQFIQAWMKDSN